MLLRTLWTMLASRRRSPLDFRDVSRVRLRVVPSDLDILKHVNNGVYLSLMDLGRIDLLVRSGKWQLMQKLGWYPVAANVTISYRRSLQPWERYTLETRLIGFDEKAMYVEQRFVSKGEVYAVGLMRARFIKKSGGTVTMQEIGEFGGVDPASMPAPQWMRDWAGSVALPAARASYPSDWD
jgi:acyl-CoA thioesterase FadM